MIKRIGLALWALSFVAGCEQPPHSERSQTTDEGGTRPPQSGFQLLPEKKVLALNPRSFCSGIPNIMEITKQSFQQEISKLCQSPVSSKPEPTQLFYDILAKPYQGQGDIEDFMTVLVENDNFGRNLVQATVAYTMLINKSTVKLLLGEEPYVATSRYEKDGFKINFKFIDPPANEGDSDTGFRVQQFTSRRGERVNFDDTSVHDLKLYRLHRNNFDFLMAARTLNAPSDQFKHSVALRAVMADPAAPESRTYSISVINLVMNGRGEENRLLDTVMDYLRDDMLSVYRYHSRPQGGTQ